MKRNFLNWIIIVKINKLKNRKLIADFEVDGVEMQIFKLIAKRLNFRWSVRQPSGGYRYGRKINDTAWKGGMIGQIFRNEVKYQMSTFF